MSSNDAIGRYRFASISAPVMVCFLAAPSHYLNLTKGVSWHKLGLRARIENESTIDNVYMESRHNNFRIWSTGTSCQILKFVVD